MAKQRRQRASRVAWRTITLTCAACDRPYTASIAIGEPIQQGRCVECAGKALLAKWAQQTQHIQQAATCREKEQER